MCSLKLPAKHRWADSLLAVPDTTTHLESHANLQKSTFVLYQVLVLCPNIRRKTQSMVFLSHQSTEGTCSSSQDYNVVAAQFRPNSTTRHFLHCKLQYWCPTLNFHLAENLDNSESLHRQRILRGRQHTLVFSTTHHLPLSRWHGTGQCTN